MAISFYALDSPELKGLESGAHLLLLGEKQALEMSAPSVAFHINQAIKLSSIQTPGLDYPAPLMRAITEKLKPSADAHATMDTWLEVDGTTVRVTLGCLPSGKASRHNCAAKPHAATEIVKSVAGGEGPLRILITLASVDHAVALGTAVARAFPLYNRKSSSSSSGTANGSGSGAGKAPRKVEVVFNMTLANLARASVLGPTAGPFDASVPLLQRLQALSDAIQLTARLVDAPPNEMHTDAIVEEAGLVLQRLQRGHPGVSITVIRGEELREKGFGGLYGVGKAAERPPALVVLSLDAPKGANAGEAKSVVWVGKGIVYDTGGLSIKTKTGMPGMKRDMGGAAAVLGAFEAAVRMGYRKGPLHAILCLAENAVSAKATRPDDVHTMYSGKTVEINNTDAEGRLVLADGVAYAAKHLQPGVILDMATLTGAQGVATGKRHAAIYANDEGLEAAIVEAGKETGDLAHSVPYAPEFFQSEFRSAVADMKNSVASRENAQCSCAAQFIGSHLGDWVNENKWCHIDMAYPVHNGERATGYGVNLLVATLEKI